MSRAVFILVTAFWVTMNVLLWQTEFGSRKSGGAVPVPIVWEKILTAADDSSLTVYREGRLVGACHLQTEVGEQWSQIGDENMPSGLPRKTRGYRLRLDGSVVVPELTNRFRFEGELNLDRKRDWKEVDARVTMRPFAWEIHSVEAEQTIRLKFQGQEGPSEVVLRFSDLQNPATLTYKLLGSSAGELAAEAGIAGNASTIALGVKWDAHEDTLRIGHTAVQVYRLHTRLMDRYDIDVLVSRAGEILRVDLPGGMVMANDRLTATEENVRHGPRTRLPVSTNRAPASNDD
ncbi:MAG TPA: hypothetical protein VN761_11995 [Candidatus Polarisedimenticolia bacterium]|nr:hypothetical protein [Candidatus Polarisedimenticolia bacterium]